MTVTMFEAKTNLSELVRKAKNGEEVIITSGRERRPEVRLQPVEPRKVQRLGIIENPKFELTDAFWEPMSDEECGYGDDPLL